MDLDSTISTRREFRAGDVIAGRYRVVSRLGQGAVGVVYKVEQIFVGKLLALKSLSSRSVSDTANRRFQQEGKAAFGLDHPNLVSVSDFGLLEDGSPFLVMELVEGQTLAERLQQGPMSYREAGLVFAQVCLGLAYAHHKGVVHRDIKPSNIMLTGRPVVEEACVKVLDFGIAKLIQGGQLDVQALTRTGEIFGSPLYMSPEQCAGLSVDHRADIYSLGCVLFECLTGAPPFFGDTALATMSQHQSKDALSLKEASFGKDFPPDLESLVASMLAKSPDRRYQDLGKTAIDLAAIARSDGKNAVITHPRKTAQKTKSESENTVALGKKAFCALLVAPVFSGLIAGYCVYISYLNTKDAKPQERSASDVAVQPHPLERSAKDEKADTEYLVKASLSADERRPKPNQTLMIHYQELSPNVFKEIAELSWIKRLVLDGCTFDSKNLSYLSRLPHLEALLLDDTNFDEAAIRCLPQMHSLERIETRGHMTTDSMAEVLSNCKGLQVIKCEQISSKGLGLLSKLPLLQRLDVNKPRLTDPHLKPMAGLLYLQALTVRDCDAFTDDTLNSLAGLRRLTWVNLNNVSISPAGLERFLRAKPDVKSITINGCNKVQEADIAKLDLALRYKIRLNPPLPEPLH